MSNAHGRALKRSISVLSFLLSKCHFSRPPACLFISPKRRWLSFLTLLFPWKSLPSSPSRGSGQLTCCHSNVGELWYLFFIERSVESDQEREKTKRCGVVLLVVEGVWLVEWMTERGVGEAAEQQSFPAIFAVHNTKAPNSNNKQPLYFVVC